MFNRYHGNNPPLTDTDDLHGRSKAFGSMDEHILNRRSVVVMGVEGVGKSSLLNCYFNLDYRKELALKRKVLINVTDFPIDRDPDGVYQYLAEGVLYAVDSLDQAETADLYNEMRAKCLRCMDECKDAASRFS